MSMTFDWGGTSRVMSDEAMDSAIFDRALPFTDTFGLSTTSGFLKGWLGTSFGRDATLPPGAPTQRGMGMQQDAPAPNVGYAQERAGIAGTNDQDFAPQVETEQQFQARRAEAGAISEETYKAAPYFRKDIPYSPEMTEPRARAQAEIRDRQKAREFFQQKRPITAFFGELTGGIADPVNFIPVFGPAVRAAAVARIGRTAGTAAVMSGEAAVSQAVFGAATAGARQQFGDDVTWQAQVTDIAMGALTGGLIGGVVGKVAGRFEARADTLRNQMKARAALDDAVTGLAEGGEVRLNPTSAGFVDEFKPDARDRVPATAEGRIETAPVAAVGRTVADDEVVTGFTTAKGSTYLLHEDGTTTRNKAARSDAGHEGDSGEKPRTLQTVYVEGDASALSAAGLSNVGEKGARVIVQDGRATLLTWNDAAGKWGASPSSRDIPVFDKPAVGRSPLELWKPADDVSGRAAYANMHAGNPIIAVTAKKADAQGRSPAQPIAKSKDFSSPVETPDPVRVQQAARAEASIGKPETTQSFAKDIGFDPETGESAISAIAKQIEAEGRLTPDDATALKAADEGIQDASAWAETLRVATGCVL